MTATQPGTAFRYDLRPTPSTRGSQGLIHVATRSDGRSVVVKLAGADATSRELLEWEGALLDALADAGVDGVVEVLDHTSIDGRPGLVMPLYSCQLGNWMRRLQAAPDTGSLAEILATMSSLASTLAAVHKVAFTQPDGKHVHLVHRDVKPENVFLDRAGRPRLGDFGCAVPIDGLAAVELALYGTPSWAPLDQVLPGHTIPDTTWDTYALCGMLFAAITGARPAYQADPRELLTARGKALWTLACRALVPGADAADSRKRFATERYGATAIDLIDCTGRSSLIAADRALLASSLDKLGAIAGVPFEARAEVERRLWNLLVRGLSPLGHPSPPNRWRDAGELAQELESLSRLVDRSDPPEPPAVAAVGEAVTTPREFDPDFSIAEEEIPPPSALVTAPIWPLFAIVAIVMATALASRGGHLPPIPWDQLSAVWGGPAVLAHTDGTTFHLDRTEVTHSRWQSCVVAGKCPSNPGAARLPVVGVTLDEARAFCTWVGGRLPTADEWRLAAGDERWPWGEDAIDCDHAIGRGCAPGPVAVGTATSGRSVEGIADLAGNASEWVDDGTLFGGDWHAPSSRIGKLAHDHPTEVRPEGAGIRCAYDRP